MPDYTPVHNPGHELTFTASAAITGGQAVEVTGALLVGPAGAASAKFVGVAAFDAAAGQRVTVFVHSFVHETNASGAITAGDALSTAVGGLVATQASPTAANFVGLAITTAAAGAPVRWIAK